MQITAVRKAAWVFIAAMPLLLIVCNLVAAWWWGLSTHWVMSLHESLWGAMVVASFLATTSNPFRAIAAGLAFLPIGSMFMMEPYTPSGPQGSGGMIYLMWPVFVVFVIAAAFIGGAVMKLMFDDLNEGGG